MKIKRLSLLVLMSIGLFLGLILLGFGAVVSVHAFPIPTGVVADGIYVGGTADLALLGWSTGNPYHIGQDRLWNIEKLIELYNDSNEPDLPPIDPLRASIEVEINSGDVLEGTFGTISLGAGADYISLKWDSVFGLWYVGDLNPEFSFSNLSANLSHYRLHNPVPEPATMLLFGAGLIGLVGVGRTKLFKRG